MSRMNSRSPGELVTREATAPGNTLPEIVVAFDKALGGAVAEVVGWTLGNRALAVWLFVSNLLLPDTSLATAWNHSLVAVMVFLLSMVPTFHTGRHAKVAVH